MDLMKQYGTDKEKEVDGVWEEFSDGIEVKIARHNNPKYKDMFQGIVAKSPRKYRGKKLSDPVMIELNAKCAARHILRDWKGVDLDGVKNVPYTEELGEKLFIALPDFYDEVIGIATNFENYRVEELEEDVGNS